MVQLSSAHPIGGLSSVFAGQHKSRFKAPATLIPAVGRLAHNKGYDLLLDAFSLVAQREPKSILHLATGGTELNNERKILRELHARAEKTGYADRIQFGSFIQEDDLPDHYRAADVFVLCSRDEAFGMTAIGAMASGTPPVVTGHGGLSFGRHAWFADPFDRGDVGITMTKIFRPSRFRFRLSRRGAHKTRSLFTWTGMAHQLVAAVEYRATATVTLHETDWDEPWNDGD